MYLLFPDWSLYRRGMNDCSTEIIWKSQGFYFNVLINHNFGYNTEKLLPNVSASLMLNTCTSKRHRKPFKLKTNFPFHSHLCISTSFLHMHSMQTVTQYTANHSMVLKALVLKHPPKAAIGKENAAAAAEFNLPPHGVCDVLCDGIDSYSLWISKQPKRDSRMFSTLFWMESTCSAGQYSSKLDLTKINWNLRNV